MPQTESAKKALRQSLKKRVVNLRILKQLKTAVKKNKKNPNSANFIKLQSILDTAAKKNVIKKNRAARLKSRLVKLLPKESKTTKPAVKKSTKKSARKKIKNHELFTILTK